MFDEVKSYKKWRQFYCANFWATLYSVGYADYKYVGRATAKGCWRWGRRLE